MSRTKSPTAEQRQSNGAMQPVLTLNEAAAYLRLPEEDVVRMVREQNLHARQVGAEWRFLKSAIDDWLRTGPPPQSHKEAWLALAGVWKEDPTVDQLREEITRHRKELITEDEQ
jgi:excisionase family DNA binding protein